MIELPSDYMTSEDEQEYMNSLEQSGIKFTWVPNFIGPPKQPAPSNVERMSSIVPIAPVGYKITDYRHPHPDEPYLNDKGLIRCSGWRCCHLKKRHFIVEKDRSQSLGKRFLEFIETLPINEEEKEEIQQRVKDFSYYIGAEIKHEKENAHRDAHHRALQGLANSLNAYLGYNKEEADIEIDRHPYFIPFIGRM